MYYHAVGFEPGVTYYWRVDEIEANGTVHNGDVWSFTAIRLQASEPVPADGARFQLVDVDLSWLRGQNAVTHDVYFSTSEQDVADGAAAAFVGNQDVTTLELDPLAPGTTYYWRVDEVDSGDSKEVGPVWSFTTVPDVSFAEIRSGSPATTAAPWTWTETESSWTSAGLRVGRKAPSRAACAPGPGPTPSARDGAGSPPTVPARRVRRCSSV